MIEHVRMMYVHVLWLPVAWFTGEPVLDNLKLVACDCEGVEGVTIGGDDGPRT